MKLDDVDLSSIEFNNYGLNTELYISYALDKQGNELTQEQLDSLNDSYETQDYISEKYWLGEL